MQTQEPTVIRPDDTVLVDGQPTRWVIDGITPANTFGGHPAKVHLSRAWGTGRVTRTTSMEVTDLDRLTLARRGNADNDAANEVLRAAGLPEILPLGGYMIVNGTVVPEPLEG